MDDPKFENDLRQSADEVSRKEGFSAALRFLEAKADFGDWSAMSYLVGITINLWGSLRNEFIDMFLRQSGPS